MNEQSERWSCPTCKEPFSWYDEYCEKCGEKLRTSHDDAKEVYQEK